MSRYECWAWLVEDHDGPGVIAAQFGDLKAPVPLQSRREDIARGMEPLARAHGQSLGRPVRLAHLIEVEDG